MGITDNEASASASAFDDVKDMSVAVDEAAAHGPGNMNVEAAALAREKGWAEPEKYDYSKYLGDRPAAASGDDGEQIVYGATAAKYEWKEEYGDVGPPNEELERMLFHNELTNRIGDEGFDQYDSSL